MVMLGRKFSAPRKAEVEQWKKVRALVEHGFFFQSVYTQSETQSKVAVSYPKRLTDVPAFVAEFGSQAAPPPQPVRASASGVKRERNRGA